MHVLSFIFPSPPPIMSFRKDRVRAIGVLKARADITSEELQTRAFALVEAVKALPIMQKNLLKYEVSFRSDGGSGELVKALGLRETEFSVMVLAETDSHEKMHETLTDPEYLKLLDGALQTITTREDFHVFPAEFVTIIDK
ncbi:hypothetical protein DFH07DRAFT_13467 [Mycena maculata]|uniref:Uncharacterized protein n=1 Tax=Mycena maculata TaxID=230809 RepID=A0AAD7N4T8_9AGAR|nr:hypothetical protein DFH07DRAFT_13467 [Mycena maculata]